MKYFAQWSTRLLFATAFAVTAAVCAAGDKPAKNDEFIFRLRDTSSLIGKPHLETLPIKTSFAELNIPLDRVERMLVDHKAGTMDVLLFNGDRLQGVCAVKEWTLTTLVGEIKIPADLVVEIVTTYRSEKGRGDAFARRGACRRNLRLIDAAKEAWAMGNEKEYGETVDMEGVNENLKDSKPPVCPSGGKYTYNIIGESPECSVHGKLPQE